MTIKTPMADGKALLEFIDVCNAVSRTRRVLVSFFQAEDDTWYASYAFKDHRGAYSALVAMVARKRAGKDAEEFGQYYDRVRQLIKKAFCQAHSGRHSAQSSAAA